jgi:peptidoglycan/LPS O-acetylase OafA/YrhL
MPELDTLRFFAFLAVFVSHIAQRFSVELLVQHHHVPFWLAKIGFRFARGGVYGVDLFFVLSTYLITGLLLREKEVTGSLHLLAFYTRRILRIWPLYYLFVILAALIPFLNPQHEFTLRYVLPFLLLMGNWSFVFLGWPNTLAVPLWSVSVEEQFYLLWPPVVARLSRRQIAIAAVAMVFIANISRLLGVAMRQSTLQLWPNTFAHLDSIAAGILLAVLVRWRNFSLRYPSRLTLVAFGLFGLAARGYFAEVGPNERMTLLATLIGYPVVVLACAAILVAFLEASFRSPVLEYLGKISYGLYIYHSMCIAIVYTLLPAAHGVIDNFMRIIVALGITIAVSAASYALVEKPFLKLKQRFTYVDSRPE